MDELLLDILAHLRSPEGLDAAGLERLIQQHNRAFHTPERRFAKKRLLPYYQKVKRDEPEKWAGWGVGGEEEKKLVALLQMKPRRTASGVATITVITKPWPCGGACLYCPNDVRMPKSYLWREPACQRAERNFFDPYLQVASRLRALQQMGHDTGKIELIVLGGTWSDYPEGYQVWFARELFRALNDGEDERERRAAERRARYRALGISNDAAELARETAPAQQRVDGGALTYNAAVRALYGAGAGENAEALRSVGASGRVAVTQADRCDRAQRDGAGAAPRTGGASGLRDAWQAAARRQTATMDELRAEHRRNEAAAHRVVGLVVETRPDTVTPESLTLLRRLGCTKVQIGVQSTDQAVLDANERRIAVERIARAFTLLRAFGFKIHAHFMVNLLGSAPEADVRDYERFVADARFQPDEVKLYPCELVGATGLVARYESGSWRPYSEDELLGVLVTDTLATPPFVRVSRMIRDISSQDILAGNKKPNLRQMVDARIAREGAAGRVREIRFREINDRTVDPSELALDDFAYRTCGSTEHFLQWVTAEGRIAGFLRLSLPDWSALAPWEGELPVRPGDAMIREVHVYGKVARLGQAGRGAQHHGLGRRLVERACAIARAAGCTRINVISAVGTRAYYRGLGFSDAGLYQRKQL